jgi:hypothetical protein
MEQDQARCSQAQCFTQEQTSSLAAPNAKTDAAVTKDELGLIE